MISLAARKAAHSRHSAGTPISLSFGQNRDYKRIRRIEGAGGNGGVEAYWSLSEFVDHFGNTDLLGQGQCFPLKLR